MVIAILLFTFSSFSPNDTNYVILNFDDGYYAVYKYAYPLLAKESIPFTLGIITSTLSPKRLQSSPYSYLTIPEIKEMQELGRCEIASHSVSHRNLQNLDSLQLAREIFTSKKVLESIFQTEVKVFIYPYGRYNRAVLRLLHSSGYSLARSVEWGEVNLFLPYRLPVKEVRRGVPISQILKQVKRSRFTILLFHRVVPNPKFFGDYGVADFTALISALKKLPNIKFLTMAEMAQRWWQEMLKKQLLTNGEKDFRLFQKVDLDLLPTPNTP